MSEKMPAEMLAALKQIVSDQESKHDTGRKKEGGMDLDIECEVLRGMKDAFEKRHQFSIGQMVRPKRGMSTHHRLGDNDVGIVVEILKEPHIDPKARINDLMYRHQVDLVVGVFIGNEDKTFHLLHVDSRRYEPVPEGSTVARTRGSA